MYPFLLFVLFLHTHSLLSSLVCSLWRHLENNNNHKAQNFVTFSIIMLFPPINFKFQEKFDRLFFSAFQHTFLTISFLAQALNLWSCFLAPLQIRPQLSVTRFIYMSALTASTQWNYRKHINVILLPKAGHFWQTEKLLRRDQQKNKILHVSEIWPTQLGRFCQWVAYRPSSVIYSCKIVV